MIKKTSMTDLRAKVAREVNTAKEISSLYNEFESNNDPGERNIIDAQIKTLAKELKKSNDDIRNSLSMLNMPKKLSQVQAPKPSPKIPSLPAKTLSPIAPKVAKPEPKMLKKAEKFKLTELERYTIKRLKKKEKKEEVKKERKPSFYVRMSNKIFSKISNSLLNKGYFRNMKRNLVKANMPYLSKSYVSMMFFSTLISFFIGFFIVGIFLFINIGASFPFVTIFTGNIIERLLKIFWLVLVIPIGTYIVMYFYPSLERKALESKIDQELPFATIHMASISESSIEPSNIFRIIISTKEYPTIEKEFTKLLNEINVFGYDLVTALRNLAFNSPSKKLTELFDGLATTITTGGDLSDFFEKRAQKLLFDYRLEREKETKSAETFMDIYISVVIAAPMILMLLLIMMRISGLGLALSTGMISLVMVLGVAIINVVFLTFLQLKQKQ